MIRFDFILYLKILEHVWCAITLIFLICWMVREFVNAPIHPPFEDDADDYDQDSDDHRKP